jgi:hypothetical protein
MKKILQALQVSAVMLGAGGGAFLLCRSAGPDGPALLTIVEGSFTAAAGGSTECSFVLASGLDTTWVEISLEPESGAQVDVRVFPEDGKPGSPEGLKEFRVDHIAAPVRLSGSVPPDVYRMVLRNADPARAARVHVKVVRDFSR